MDNRPTQALKRPRNAVVPPNVREQVLEARVRALEAAVTKLLELSELPPLEALP